MRFFYYICTFPFLLGLWSCGDSSVETLSLTEILADQESIVGKTSYSNSPYVTAGDRLYVVGHQNGTFPDLGWHIPGEMGGIWDHPIKLMDGFVASLNGQCLTKASRFTNYPMASQFEFDFNEQVRVIQTQYVADGQEALNIEYEIINSGLSPMDLKFAFTVRSDLRPVWLGEQTGMLDAPDQARWTENEQAIIIKDSLNKWFTLIGNNRVVDSYSLDQHPCEILSSGTGTLATLVYKLTVPASDKITIPMIIAGSSQSEIEAIKTYEHVSACKFKGLAEKIERYDKLRNQTKLTIPDKDIETAFRWVKYNTDWLIRDVEGIGRGLGAGIPDYPWWFGVDNEYALQGAIITGRKELVDETINLIHRISEEHNGNGRIVHEVSTNGVVFNPGNINETAQFATLVRKVFDWTGDTSFVRQYYPSIKKGFEWLLDHDEDENFVPEGFGIMEIHGLDSEMIDVAVNMYEGLEALRYLSFALNDHRASVKYLQQSRILKEKIIEAFWVEEHASFADFIGTREEALVLIDDAINRADSLEKPWAVEELQKTKSEVNKMPKGEKKGFVLHHNWVVNLPMAAGIVDSAKAVKALNTGGKFTNPFGVFVTGIDRDESAGTDEGSFAQQKKRFDYTGAVMTLPTGVMAVAENNYERPDKALEYLKKLTHSFSYALPGSIYEVSPDFGMMTQAWTIYSYAVPIVEQFFGIQPNAFSKKITIRPQLPSEWNYANLENIQIANNTLSIFIKKNVSGMNITLAQSDPTFEIDLILPADHYYSYTLNGEPIGPIAGPFHHRFPVKGQKINLQAWYKN